MSAPAVVPLILAAGASSRMGRPKAALPFGETTALGLVLATCRASGLAPAVVVHGADEAAVRAAAAGFGDARLVANPRWAAGRTTSLQAGLRALPEDAEAWLLWPVDVCLPGRDVVEALLAARRAHPDGSLGALAWVPSHAGRRGHPALFASAAASRFLALGPDASAREVVRALAAEGRLEHVLTDEASVLMDMNTPEAYARWLSAWSSGEGRDRLLPP